MELDRLARRGILVQKYGCWDCWSALSPWPSSMEPSEALDSEALDHLEEVAMEDSTGLTADTSADSDHTDTGTTTTTIPTSATTVEEPPLSHPSITAEHLLVPPTPSQPPPPSVGLSQSRPHALTDQKAFRFRHMLGLLGLACLMAVALGIAAVGEDLVAAESAQLGFGLGGLLGGFGGGYGGHGGYGGYGGHGGYGGYG
ncbi:unnamed protein product, partial [Darwinula stevensoni]